MSLGTWKPATSSSTSVAAAQRTNQRRGRGPDRGRHCCEEHRAQRVPARERRLERDEGLTVCVEQRPREGGLGQHLDRVADDPRGAPGDRRTLPASPPEHEAARTEEHRRDERLCGQRHDVRDGIEPDRSSSSAAEAPPRRGMTAFGSRCRAPASDGRPPTDRARAARRSRRARRAPHTPPPGRAEGL